MWLSILALLAIGLVAAACGDSPLRSPAPVQHGSSARLELEDHGSASLTVTSIRALKGTYGSACLERAGTWTIPLNGYEFIGGETALTVEGGDVACTLFISEVKAGAVDNPLSYTCAAPFALATGYAASGVAFKLNGAGETVFYANFRAEPDLGYQDNFLVRMAYSDDVKKTNADYNTQYDVVTATAVAGLVQAPNATLSLAELDVRVTATNVVKSAVGNVLLTQGAVPGQRYTIDMGTLDATASYGSVDAFFTNPATVKVDMVGATQLIPAIELGLLTVDLTAPKVRSIIMANTESGVTSYQLFRISFRRHFMGAGPVPLALKTANNFAILAKIGVTLGAGAGITGDVGLDALAGLTGFGEVADASGTYFTGSGVTGRIYTAANSKPTPAMLATAAADMTAVYAEAVARIPVDGTDKGGAELGGQTLLPGLYHWTTAATLTGALTLDGGANDVWILRVNGALAVAADAYVLLVNGAQASNVYWVVVGAVTGGAGSVIEGQVLSGGAISTGVGTVLNGRALSATGVSIGAGSTVHKTSL
jgi:hypothetical protein